MAQDSIILCTKEDTGEVHQKAKIRFGLGFFFPQPSYQNAHCRGLLPQTLLAKPEKLSGSTCFQEQTILLLYLVYCAVHKLSLEATN